MRKAGAAPPPQAPASRRASAPRSSSSPPPGTLRTLRASLTNRTNATLPYLRQSPSSSAFLKRARRRPRARPAPRRSRSAFACSRHNAARLILLAHARLVPRSAARSLRTATLHRCGLTRDDRRRAASCGPGYQSQDRAAACDWPDACGGASLFLLNPTSAARRAFEQRPAALHLSMAVLRTRCVPCRSSPRLRT